MSGTTVELSGFDADLWETFMRGGAWVAHSEYMRVMDENARLRELVRELWDGYMDPPCEDCPLKDTPTCADCPICAREAAVIDRMRKLGIEVDK